jgi:hypothetical protein
MTSLSLQTAQTTDTYSAGYEDAMTERAALLAAVDAVRRHESDAWLLRAARERLLAQVSRATAVREAFVLPGLRSLDPSARDQVTTALRRTEHAMAQLVGSLGGDWYARTSPRQATDDLVDALVAQLELEASMGSTFTAALATALTRVDGRRLPTRPHATLRGRRARTLLSLYASVDAIVDVTNARLV